MYIELPQNIQLPHHFQTKLISTTAIEPTILHHELPGPYTLELIQNMDQDMMGDIAAVQADDGIEHHYLLNNNTKRLADLHTQGEKFVILKDGDKVIGFSSIRLIPSLDDSEKYAAQVRFIEILEKHQGRGFGSQLASATYELGRAAGADYIISHVESGEANDIGAAKENFLKKLAFEHIYTDPYYYIVDGKHNPSSAWVLNFEERNQNISKLIPQPKSENRIYQNDSRVMVLYRQDAQIAKIDTRIYLHPKTVDISYAGMRIQCDKFGDIGVVFPTNSHTSLEG